MRRPQGVRRQNRTAIKRRAEKVEAWKITCQPKSLIINARTYEKKAKSNENDNAQGTVRCEFIRNKLNQN